MKHKPLFSITFTTLIAMVLLAVAPISIFNIKNFREFFHEETELFLLEGCRVLKNLYPQYSSKDSQALSDFAESAANATSLRVTITREDGTVLSDSHNDPAKMNNHALRPEIKAAMKEGSGTSIRNSPTMENEMMYAAIRISFTDGKNGTIRIARSIEEIDSRIRSITRSVFVIGFIAFALAIWISFVVANKVSEIISKVKSTSRYYASGDFSGQLQIHSPVDIAEIADDLNQMGIQLKQRIEKIEEQKSELRLILDSMTEPVLYTDSSLHTIKINRSAEKLFGINEDDDSGKSIIEIFMNSELNGFAENLVKTGESGEAVIMLNLPRPVDLEINGTVLFDASEKNVIALLLVMHDITKTKKLEQMRKDFVSNVSHELKTPVTMIKGYVETMLDNPERSKEETNKFLQIIEKHSLRVEAIINDLLFLSGIEKNGSGNLTLEKIPAIDLITSAASSCEAIAEEKNIKIKISCDENLEMEVYPLLAEQALINLVNNAVKYSEKGTEIKIKAFRNENGRSCLTVKDQGCGIAPADQERIFERFYRVDKARSRESGGTGLGLSIVKHIALTHNGSINLKSIPGKGSTFTLCL